MVKKMPHSKFRLTNTNLQTTGFGRLTPFFFQPIVPGDRLSLGSSFQIQLMPLIAPAFQDCRVYTHYYYIPERICHLNEEYNAFVAREQRQLFGSAVPRTKTVTTIGDMVNTFNRVYRNNGSGSVVPYVTNGNSFDNMLPDYLRVQLGSASNYSSSKENVIIEPFVAFFKMYLDHYVSTQYCTYFITSTSTSGQYSYTAISYNDLLYFYSYLQNVGYDHTITYSTQCFLPVLNANIYVLDILLQIPHVMYGVKGDMFMEMYPTTEAASTSQPIGTTVESLRIANAVQKYNERKARVGHGTADFLWEFFHVKNRDSRLQVSSFLGGGRSTLNIDDVIQTSESETNDTSDFPSSALGQMAGNAWKKTSFGFGRRYFDEFGYVFGVYYILPKQSYFQGVDNLYTRLNADDQYLEAFDSIGDEPVYTKELYFHGNSTYDDVIMAYQPRYQRYKRAKNEVHGDFRKDLLFYHQSRFLPNTVNAENLRMAFAGPQGLNRVFNTAFHAYDSVQQPIMVYVKNSAVWRRKMRYKPRPHL